MVSVVPVAAELFGAAIRARLAASMLNHRSDYRSISMAGGFSTVEFDRWRGHQVVVAGGACGADSLRNGGGLRQATPQTRRLATPVAPSLLGGHA